MDIEPIQSLAFSMQARPKLYALLLGSGVSRAAGILTGWEVVLDLVRKLMVMQRVVVASDPHKWYRDKYGADPDYSELIKRVAPTSAERQQVLRQYWEANAADEADTSKRPTAAHRAIADLVTGGFVKVILTTNFDRLIESALRDAGVEPAVLSSSDDITGMMPLDHTDCCVIKLHGDYLDERILNTADELSKYPTALNGLLDRILDEYGLVVCGWSGDWDVALSKAIRRAKSRRYTTYWAAYGPLGDEANRIIQAREARVIKIESADRLFEDLSSLVHAIEDQARPNPLSVNAAVAQCEQFLARDEDRIRLANLIDSIGKGAFDGIVTPPKSREFHGTSLTDYFRRCEGACSKLLATAVTASYWSRDAQIDVWRNTIQRFFLDIPSSGSGSSIAVSAYPGILLTYALAIGAVTSGQLENIAKVLTFPTGRDVDTWTAATRYPTSEQVVAQYFSEVMLEVARQEKYFQSLEGMERHVLPMNDWLFQSLRSHTTKVIHSDVQYERMFDRTEVLLALRCHIPSEGDWDRPWFPMGCFLHRRGSFNATIREIEESLSERGDDSAFVRLNFVGHSAREGLTILESFRKFVGSVANALRVP